MGSLQGSVSPEKDPGGSWTVREVRGDDGEAFSGVDNDEGNVGSELDRNGDLVQLDLIGGTPLGFVVSRGSGGDVGVVLDSDCNDDEG